MRHEHGFFKTAYVVGKCQEVFFRVSQALLEDEATLEEIHELASYVRIFAPRAGIYIVGGYSFFPIEAIQSDDPGDAESVQEAYEIETIAFEKKKVPSFRFLLKKAWRHIPP